MVQILHGNIVSVRGEVVPQCEIPVWWTSLGVTAVGGQSAHPST